MEEELPVRPEHKPNSSRRGDFNPASMGLQNEDDHTEPTRLEMETNRVVKAKMTDDNADLEFSQINGSLRKKREASEHRAKEKTI